MADKNLATINQGFGVVTVINAKCVSIAYLNTLVTDWAEYCKVHTASEIAQKIYDAYEGSLVTKDGCYIDTLKVANLNIEGPSKTITGGQYANPLIKFGKTSTCELQDALGHADALALLGGVEIDSNSYLHVTSKFGKPVAILGDTFVIDRETGDQVPVMEVIYQFLPDSIINLTQAGEGDATVFDLNGSLMATDVKKGENTVYYGAFYSIIDPVTGSEPEPSTPAEEGSTPAEEATSGQD